MSLTERLAALNVQLPAAPVAAGAYIPAKRAGNLIYVAGQLPFESGKLSALGRVPSNCPIDAARAAARQCVLNALAAVSGLPGGIDQIRGVVRAGVFVCSDDDFNQQPQVANGASEFLIELLGDAGRHVRAAVGVNVLPLGASVEVELIFQC